MWHCIYAVVRRNGKTVSAVEIYLIFLARGDSCRSRVTDRQAGKVIVAEADFPLFLDVHSGERA